MNFDFTDDQQAIKSTAHDFLAARLKPEKLRELAESGSYDDALWKEMSELGWPGIFIGEEHGGQGLGVVELIILMEELGYALAPVPFLSNAAAGLMIQAAGSEEQKQRWLPGIASGEARGAAGLLRGDEARLVPDGDSAELIVLCGAEGVAGWWLWGGGGVWGWGSPPRGRGGQGRPWPRPAGTPACARAAARRSRAS